MPDAVFGASIKIISDESISIDPQVVRTDSDRNTIVSLTTFEGPNISFDIIATAEGQDSFTVDAPEKYSIQLI